MTQKCLYDYNAEELIRNKDIVQFRLHEFEMDYKKQEAELLLTTDFKELGLTNEKMRNAYITKELLYLKGSIDLHKNSLNIINDLLKLRLTELTLQGGETP